MDVVQSNIERIGGLISLDNRPGRGLSIILRVPLTLTIIPGLIIRAGGQHFAIPRAAVVEILHDNNQMLRIFGVGGARIATIDRKSVVVGKGGSVRVDYGGGRVSKKKK